MIAQGGLRADHGTSRSVAYWSEIHENNPRRRDFQHVHHPLCVIARRTGHELYFWLGATFANRNTSPSDKVGCVKMASRKTT